ncbi:MAG: DUF1045 domain-containing protein [Alphaproteobacteria bacterium]|nr:DUF1045 domain-containing protein [Alphaproteobacteria bacterium]
MTERFAIYFAPGRDTRLWEFGTSWLGRDPETGNNIQQPAIADVTAVDLESVTRSPRRYGFHATLKPPFTLADGTSQDRLDEALTRFARDRIPFDAPPLRFGLLDGFLALVPSAPAPALSELAAACVQTFEPFRAPLSREAITRRRHDALTARQDANLLEWGYPYVMEDFRFHMTLTERLDAQTGSDLADALNAQMRPLIETPVAVDGIALFHEPVSGGPFRLLRRYPFTP